MLNESVKVAPFTHGAPYDEKTQPVEIFDTLTGGSRPFVPLDRDKEPRTKMYVCGLTPYDSPHVGHALAAIRFDVIRRYLDYRNLRPQFVTNITDIDDKIIAAAVRTGRPPQELTAEYSGQYFRLLSALNVIPPDATPAVSNYLPEILDYIDRLIQKGRAYHTPEGNVYFRVGASPDYGKLSRQKVHEMRHGSRIETASDKEASVDFALWKRERDEQFGWRSPWGVGRPGWHIECSCMIFHTLGEQIDIHGGGLDLKFPHHENEIAQSEAFTGLSLASHWCHSGLLNLGGQKMSKSLGGTIRLADAVETIGPDLFRFTLIRHHYRQDFDYDNRVFVANLNPLLELHRAAAAARALLGRVAPRPDSFEPGELRKQFEASMDSDFDSPATITALIKKSRFILSQLDSNLEGSALERTLARDCFELLGVMACLGVCFQSQEEFIASGLRLLAATQNTKPTTAREIADWLQRRADARNERRFDKADLVRAEAKEAGVAIEDLRNGVYTWRFLVQS